MSMIVVGFRKSLIVALLAALSLAALPFAGAAAQTTQPPASALPAQPSNQRLQTAWAKEQMVFARIGKILDRAGGLISRIQSRLDKAQAGGKDVSAVQAALNAFSQAIKNVQPIYAGMQTAVQSHAGFDASGNVTDPTLALQTVRDFHAQAEQIRQAGVREAGRALRQAIQALRRDNQAATPSPAPANG